ncbi:MULTISPECIES: flagellar biosynthetic protein FliR [Shouchella]|uniref:Flagellar biosynthetic protein FliR n=3 Tax=Shouchella TaxID=2893057 RepID=Q3V824_SHOC1|nr:flagellar biosynthetic protein FliR [Shouchella clausii]KKI87841.1 flagellar biosynthesis protein FliR [Shouchella clausii]MDO7267235.1 flagellar biosynthetic protein FliR [Shouchella clausii]MDO7282376.1 flagellar biosynthetic protein FliR [Shouchella clausii]MDO7287811.1 flagellar biosynthetic protein FliR [Shouchella clausii]MDO7302471.1 flagellar biosynthetic protein FliR [Shouchella clausii]
MDEWLTLYPAFLLIFIRVSSFFVVLPLFNHRTVPAPLKLGLSAFLAATLAVSLDVPELALDLPFLLLALKEFAIGIAAGLMASMILYAVQVAGGVIDFHLGFMLANVVDPQTGAQSPLTGSYLYLFAMLYLLIIDGHHLLLDGVIYSYQFVPLDQLVLPFGSGHVMEHVTQVMVMLFAMAVSMAMPVAGALFLVDVALGIISRTVPQMNVFVVGIPIKMLAGFIVFAIYIGVFFMSVNVLFEELLLAMRRLLEGLGGGPQ